jgi:dethiobiotin synthase
MPAKVIFITGTDTGVGKTVLTACLLEYLRQTGVHALAMKPFCSGSRGDVDLLQSIQESQLPDDVINPFYFPDAIAPRVAARKAQRKITLADVLRKIRDVARQCDCLLIEGSGGLLVPLGEGYTVADLIGRLRCEVLVAARNRLGTINHTLLTVEALRRRTRQPIKVVLIDQAVPDLSARTNQQLLVEAVAPVEVVRFPFLGKQAPHRVAIRRSVNTIKALCARMVSTCGHELGAV